MERLYLGKHNTGFVLGKVNHLGCVEPARETGESRIFLPEALQPRSVCVLRRRLYYEHESRAGGGGAFSTHVGGTARLGRLGFIAYA